MAPPRRIGVSLAETSPGIGPIVVLGLLVALPVGLAITVDDSTYDTWGAFVWAPVLLTLAYPLCRWVTYRTGEPQLAGFFFAAAVLKIVVGGISRYYVFDAYYDRAGDAATYDDAAGLLATPFRHGIFENLGPITGTRFIGVLAGAVQAVIGQTEIGTWLVFSFAGFAGICLLYVAFCEALPNGNRTLYRRLIFLMPTMWFWPSSLGKEAVLMLFIGLVAFGFTRLLNGHLLGLFPVGLGFWGTAVVRPHIALMLAVGAIAALPPSFRQHHPGAGADATRRARRLVLPVLALLVLPVLLHRAEEFFNIDGLDVDSANEVRDEVTQRTSAGGSEFSAPDTSTPVGLVAGIVVVAVRPFPWESQGIQLAAAVESLLLGGLIVAQLVRYRVGFFRILRDRWPRFALGYVLSFAWGFSAVSNFGILARQRSLMLPFLFVLIAAPEPRQDERRSGGHPPAEVGQPVGGSFVRLRPRPSI